MNQQTTMDRSAEAKAPAVERAPAPASSPKRSGKRWILNTPLLLGTVGLLVVLAPAIFFLHKYQVGRNAAALLTRVDNFKEDEWRSAAASLYRYLQLQPEDLATHVRLAELLDKRSDRAATAMQAANAYAHVIGILEDPDRQVETSGVDLLSLRRRHCELLLLAGYDQSAADYADKLLEADSEDKTGLKVKALGLHQLWRKHKAGRPAQVVETLEVANGADPTNGEVALALAHMLRQDADAESPAEQVAKADAVIDQMVQASADKAKAFLVRYGYRRELKLAGADEDLQNALAADTQQSNFDVQLAVAVSKLQAKDWAAAEVHFERCTRLRHEDRRGYRGLFEALQGQQKHKEAIEILQTYLANENSRDIEFQLEIAARQVAQGEYVSADKTLDGLEAQLKSSVDRQQNLWLAITNHLRGEIHFSRRQHSQAIGSLQRAMELEQSAQRDDSSKQRLFAIHTRLGQSYLALRQYDQAAASFESAAQMQPTLAHVRTLAAQAWDAAGSLDEALRHYEAASQMEGVASDALLSYAEALFRQASARPKSQRTGDEELHAWAKFIEILNRANEATRRSPRVVLLEARFQAARGNLAEALELVQGVEEQVVKSGTLVPTLAVTYELIGRPEDADRLVEKFMENRGQWLQGMVLRAELLSRRGKYEDAIRELTSLTIAGISADQRRLIQYQLTALYLLQGKKDQARGSLKELVRKDTENRQAFQMLFDLALEQDNLREAEELNKTLVKLEGTSGTRAQLNAAQIEVKKAVREKAPAQRKLHLDAATRIQQAIQRSRPQWAPAYLLKARLALMSDKPDANAAIDALLRAVRLGEKRLVVLQELVALLNSQNRLAEASVYLDRYRDADDLPPELAGLSMLVDLKQGNQTRALAVARRESQENPNDALGRLRLGQILTAELPRGQTEKSQQWSEAEAEFLKARELKPKEPLCWSALFSFYANTRHVDDARRLLKEFEEADVLTNEDEQMFLGNAYALLAGQSQPEAAADLERAKQLVGEAASSARERFDVQVNAANFFLRYDLPQAQKYAKRALELEPTNSIALRLSALSLAGTATSAKDYEQILGMLDAAEGASSDPANRRLKSLALLRQGGETNRAAALSILEGLSSQKTGSVPLDRLLLAQLYESRGDGDKAREQLGSLIQSENPSADHLAAYVELLLRTGHAKDPDAERRLDQLAKIEPAATHFRTVQLRSKWLNQLGRNAEIKPVVEAFITNAKAKVKQPTDLAPIWLAAANLYSSAELLPEAEDAFRQAIAIKPAAYSALAAWLAEQNRMEEAIQICIDASQSDQTVMPAMALAHVMTVGKSDGKQQQAAELFLAQAERMHSKNTGLLFSIATMRLMANELDEATRLLKRVLELDPKNLPAINNLAMALSQKAETQKEALSLADRAISIAGRPVPELLDSKGWILLQQQRAAEAEQQFRDALAAPPGQARYFFHLALAQQQQGKVDEARNSYQRATELNLAEELLSPIEKSQLARLETALR